MRFKRDWIESLEQMVFFEKGGVHKGGQDILLAAESTLFCTHKRDRAAAQHKSILCVSSIDRAYSIVAAAHADTAADRRKRFLCVCLFRAYLQTVRMRYYTPWAHHSHMVPLLFSCVCLPLFQEGRLKTQRSRSLSVSPNCLSAQNGPVFFLSRHLRRYSEAIPYWII